MKKNYAIYQVAFKIFLRKGNNVLFLKLSNKDTWDWPGGRADKNEGRVPIKKILAREIREELGSDIKYKIGKIAFQYRRKCNAKNLYNLITVYEGEYISGGIKLSNEHNTYQWLNPKKFRFNKRNYPNREEFAAFKEYLK
ncbi:MAG: hypothetical protein A3H01_00305 [Candidatus Wildermuthbacteria bacterium RIFCSPLOWO2_12_FULL_40_9]|uniref:Nudix hydrolase domain-containing protein n=2 Tax=Candidatus Wildermuthiibacteriota TaxID=1817923 RepID=A0A1G2RCX5_9BACT|nr:MAG: hypothetical protein A3F15_02295 [Candidatus Wildermuthbacteria bacterium RIFCSPHIGHO2_12_FULL_40_12]OHA76530.1 MAG: hypothetical protein A3H01_00305 [Candidatus Wildermuthbacteria bacterium RIFCSPLOWO2_12_FULL_40_9]